MSELGALDVLAPHSANRRGREKKLADLRFVPDIENSHTVTYALTKLARLGLVRGTRRGTETFHATTDNGRPSLRRLPRRARELPDRHPLGAQPRHPRNRPLRRPPPSPLRPLRPGGTGGGFAVGDETEDSIVTPLPGPTGWKGNFDRRHE